MSHNYNNNIGLKIANATSTDLTTFMEQLKQINDKYNGFLSKPKNK